MKVMVAALQYSMSDEIEANLLKAIKFVREAARLGANIILLPELFLTPYFCKIKNERYFQYAKPLKNHPVIAELSLLAAELGVVLPVSFFEKAENSYFNSLVVIDADGEVLDLYRKCHIPSGPGYEETFYFNKGDLGFKTFKTQYGVIGCGICWDQWFPEAARDMVLQGAQMLFYPTAIGSEPKREKYSSAAHWQRVMQGHAAANMVPVIAANRVGVETDDEVTLTFYGSSFITDNRGEVLSQAGNSSEEILMQSLDIDTVKVEQDWWGLFRDRRVDLY